MFELYNVHVTRSQHKSVHLKISVLISQSKQMFWVLKRTVSVKMRDTKIAAISRLNSCLSGPMNITGNVLWTFIYTQLQKKPISHFLGQLWKNN